MKELMTVNSKIAVIVIAGMLGAGTALADDDNGACTGLPGYDQLRTALVSAVVAETSGFNLNMWATIVDRDGNVCAVAYSGNSRGSQWIGSRVISAQKANTANLFTLDPSSSSNSSGAAAGLALSTANLYAPTQPGGSLFGLQESNPVDVSVAYRGPSNRWGTGQDPMVGRKIGGVNVFGGGLGLYDVGHKLMGGVGVSGDTSCADHNIAWRVRNSLGMDHMAPSPALPAVGGVSGDATRPDNIVFDIVANPDGGTGKSAGGFGHPTCANTAGSDKLPVVQQ